jgi:hypothetical protein
MNKRKEGEKIEGLILAARYSLMPSKLEICTSRGKYRVLLRFLTSPTTINKEEAREVLKSLPVCYPYLELIAKTNNISNPFDVAVVQAYFVGSKLTEKVSLGEATKKTIKESFGRIGFLDQKEMEERIKSLPEDFKPHHNFHTFCLGSVTGKVAPIPEILDLCRISWGEVIKITANEVLLRYRPLRASKKGGYFLGEVIEKRIRRKTPPLFPFIGVGDIVTLHWNQLCQVIDQGQLRYLRRYTLQALSSAKIWGED